MSVQCSDQRVMLGGQGPAIAHVRAHGRAHVRAHGRAIGRRGFTLVELVLAAALSAIIAAACVGLYTTIARADDISRQRTEAIVDMSRVHRALQRAVRTMLLDDTPPKRDETRQARIALMEAAHGPRFELTLMRPPVLGLIAGKPMDPTSRHTPMAGAFELRQAPARTRGGRAVDDGLELWWTPYPPGTRAARTGADGTAEGMLVSGGLRSLDIAFAKTGENKQLDRFKTGEITDWNNIPAFVEVNVEMLDGQRASWMLEVAAQGGRMPGTAGAGDSDIPIALLDRLRAESGPNGPEGTGAAEPRTDSSGKPRDPRGSDSGAGGGGPSGSNGPGGDGRPPRDPADEARRLAEAFEMLNRLLQQLAGGGGGGGGDE